MFSEDADPQLAQRDFADDTLIVRTLPGAEPTDVASALGRAGATAIETLPEIETIVARVAPADLLDVAEQLAGEPTLEAVQKNYFFDAQLAPDDPRFADQAPLEVIGLPDAWEISTGSDSVLVAVLDTGVYAGHADLAGRTLAGRNTFDRSADSSDVFGHGTLVAGVLGAASDNGTGVAGVDWESQILAVRVANAAGRASSAAIASGIVWAVNRGARVINVSFAPLQADGLVLRAARHAYASGALVFISAGNDGKYSTARGSREAVFVGATDDSDALAGFSSTGPFVDLTAPGVAIWSTTHEGDYRAVSGTSFASPIAAGVAALVWSARPELRPVTVERLLRDTAVDLGAAGRDDTYGAGRVDAAAALAAARDIIEAEDHRAPIVTLDMPADGAEVSGTIRVGASAADLDDGVGVAEVVLYVDGAPVVSDTAFPYRFALATQRLASGAHTVGVVAIDDAGNASTPAEVTVYVAGDGSSGDTGTTDTQRPSVTIQFPIAGANITGQVGIQAIATDNVALQSVELLVDGIVRESKPATGSRATVSFVWLADGATVGDHVITIRAVDTAENRGATSVVVTK
ncbi:MAG TPA: S8 family serine peptidase [Phycisphaerae bacterium]|nr:S8 family serine peptidase [Phycisphaerales bacterium]HRX86283.1 S8 family serine peptidase [Phycisphaerae bacterium]